MNFEDRLGAWQSQWQTGPAETDAVPVPLLRQRVERESRRMKVGLLAPAAVTAGIGGSVLLRALGSLETPDLVLAVGVWMSILVAWAGTLRIAHGTWRPLGQTTAAYLDISIRRCRSSMTTAKFGAALYLAQLAFILVFKLLTEPSGGPAVLWAWPTIVLGWIGFPLFLGWLGWYLRRKRAELAALVDAQAQLDGLR